MDFLRRTWAQIDLDALRHNYTLIREKLAPDCRMLCVVKADGYGHGAVPVARELAKNGADYFAVSNIEEAKDLRQGGLSENILILGYTPLEKLDELWAYNIAQTVFSLPYAEALSEKAKEKGAPITVHVKLDTGMGRLGFPYYAEESSIEEIQKACTLPGLTCEGIFTHFAASDMAEEDSYTQRQFDLFMNGVERLAGKGVTFQYRHCCNSAAVLRHPDMHLDMVRPGLILYGLSPAEDLPSAERLVPVMSLKTVISQLKWVEEGQAVSYGLTYRAKRPTRLATLPVGYADGYSRSLSNRGTVCIKGQEVPIAGRVCMDQTVADVTDIPGCTEKDIVTLFGTDGSCTIPVERIAELAGTINYEIVCDIGKRVARIFIKDGQEAGILNYYG